MITSHNMINEVYWNKIWILGTGSNQGNWIQKECREYCDVKYSLYMYEKGEMQVNGKK